jgi:hypothetical protein
MVVWLRGEEPVGVATAMVGFCEAVTPQATEMSEMKIIKGDSQSFIMFSSFSSGITLEI